MGSRPLPRALDQEETDVVSDQSKKWTCKSAFGTFVFTQNQDFIQRAGINGQNKFDSKPNVRKERSKKVQFAI